MTSREPPDGVKCQGCLAFQEHLDGILVICGKIVDGWQTRSMLLRHSAVSTASSETAAQQAYAAAGALLIDYLQTQQATATCYRVAATPVQLIDEPTGASTRLRAPHEQDWQRSCGAVRCGQAGRGRWRGARDQEGTKGRHAGTAAGGADGLT